MTQHNVTLSSKDIILRHLHSNRGREIPVSEIAEIYDLKVNTISNAIKELKYKKKINIKRRQLRRGRYTVIWTLGERLTAYYFHPKEKIKPRIIEYFKDNKGKLITLSNLIKYFNSNIKGSIINKKDIAKNLDELVAEKEIYSEIIDKNSKKTLFRYKDDTTGVQKSLLKSSSKEKLNFGGLIQYLNSSEFDSSQFQTKIQNYYSNNLSFITEIVTPIEYEVGKRWAQTLLTTADEHIITTRLEKIIVNKIIDMKISKYQYRRSIVLVPVEYEEHTLGLLSLELIFTELRYKVINIGRALPIQSLIQYIRDLEQKPNWIFFSITLPTYLTTLVHDVNLIKNTFNTIFIAIGGQGITKSNKHLFPEVDQIIVSKKELISFIEYMT